MYQSSNFLRDIAVYTVHFPDAHNCIVFYAFCGVVTKTILTLNIEIEVLLETVSQ